MTAQANPLSPDNVALHKIDLAIQDMGLKPENQMGVLIIALTLAMRRFLAANRITERGRRMRLIKEAVRQFDSKLRRYVGTPERMPVAQTSDPIEPVTEPKEAANPSGMTCARCGEVGPCADCAAAARPQ